MRSVNHEARVLLRNALIAAAAAALFSGTSFGTDVWSGTLDDPRYAGSEACGECHEGRFDTWQGSLHARMLIRPEEAQAAGFPLPPSGFGVTIDSWSDVRFLVGQKWRTVYVDQDGRIQGKQWNMDLGRWVDFVNGVVVDYDCGACHTTGYDPDATFEDPPGSPAPGIVGAWVEYSVGCEACHGPGAEHAANPSRGNINRILFDWYDADGDGRPDRVDVGSSVLCGNCHYRGDRQGVRTDRLSREQYNDWLSSPHSATLEPTSISTYCARCHSPGNADAQAAEHNFAYFPLEDTTHVACISCHDPHRTSNERWATLEWPVGGQQNPQDFQATLSRYYGTDGDVGTNDHVPFANDASSELCSDCHKLQPGFRRHVDARPGEVIVLSPPFSGGVPFVMPHTVHVEQGYAQCVDCHMHYSRRSANAGDIRSHSLIPNEAFRLVTTFALPHYSETCGQCHSEALNCDWCHAGLGGRFRRQLVPAPDDSSRRRKTKRGVSVRD